MEEVLDPKDLLEHKELLNEVARKAGFQNPAFAITSGAKKGDNFIGIVYRVKVTEQQQDASRPELSWIVKIQPQEDPGKQLIRTELFYQIEDNFYNKVLPAMINFQKNCGISEKFAPSVPICYHASAKDIVILEDMMPYGFKSVKRDLLLDFEHCTVVFKELGRLHAVSFALRDQNPSLFRELTKDLKDGYIVPDRNPGMVTLYDDMVELAVKDMNKLEMVDKEKYVEIFERFSKGYYSKVLESVDGTRAEPYSVINHGDLWNANVLFQYGPDGKTPLSISLLDYQLIRYASPATDVTYFLYSCTGQEIRDKHYTELTDIYYSSLASFLKQLGSDPEKVFPKTAWEDQLMKFGVYGIGLALIEVRIFTSEIDDRDTDVVPEGGDSIQDVRFDLTTTDAGTKRVCDVIVDSINRGYIK